VVLTLFPIAVTTPVPVVVVAGAAPAPPPKTIALAANAAEDAHVDALLKYGIPPDVPATVKAGVVVAVATEIIPPVNDTLVTVPVVAHVPSPRKYVVADGVPVTAPDSAVTELINVPDVGRVTDVDAVAVSVVLNAPDVVRFPPNVIVLEPLLTPVPP
jgi:hypothetical protein